MNTTATENIQLQVKRLIKAPRERVFKAWSNAEEMKQWFMPGKETKLLSLKADVRVGGKFRIQNRHPDGGFCTAAGTYREVKAPERLVFSWAFEKDGSGPDFGEVEPLEMVVTVEFLERGEQTMVVLTHERFASDESRDQHLQGWNSCLETLEKHFDGTATENIKLEIKRHIKAPRERVFKAWIDPVQIKQWFAPSPEIAVRSAKADPRVGGKYRIQTQKPDGEYFTAAGTYREVKAPDRLSFTWAWEKDGSEPDFGELESQETLITLEFLAQGNETMLVMTQEKFASVESRDKHIGGWTGCLESLAKVLGGAA